LHPKSGVEWAALAARLDPEETAEVQESSLRGWRAPALDCLVTTTATMRAGAEAAEQPPLAPVQRK